MQKLAKTSKIAQKRQKNLKDCVEKQFGTAVKI